MSKKRFSQEEDICIANAVKYYPHNLTNAFKHASLVLGRDWRSISYRWYKYISTKEEYAYCFMTHGPSTIHNNRKINRPDVLIKPKLINNNN